jgi:hypothetical protein
MNIETRAYFTILKAVAPHLKWKEADWSSDLSRLFEGASWDKKREVESQV